MTRKDHLWFNRATKLSLAISCLVCLSAKADTGSIKSDSRKFEQLVNGSASQPSLTTTLVQEQAEINFVAVAQNVEEKLWPAFGSYCCSGMFGGVVDPRKLDDPLLIGLCLTIVFSLLAQVFFSLYFFYRLVSSTWNSVLARTQSRYTTLKDG